MENLIENVLEWITGDNTITATFSQRKFITKVKRLAEKYPDEVKIIYENADGSIVAHLPLNSIKLSIIKRELTDEQRQEMGERLKKVRELKDVDEDDDEGDEL